MRKEEDGGQRRRPSPKKTKKNFSLSPVKCSLGSSGLISLTRSIFTDFLFPPLFAGILLMKEACSVV
ncbi:hypothetical protein SDJN03_09395, partial [Cucurbita argyrosperma subsp. sororia]